ncbi:hypothetical protein RND81_08G174900 [Saponaria officinalis]|uniref:S-protein homolog n=1 Tax=Saponaria officinalis TaxID=3572 RepID=A0AAW1J8M1_SAPOF
MSKIYKFALVFILALTFFIDFSEGLFDLGHVKVRVNNTLSNGKKLLIHCKSKDNDLSTVEVAHLHVYNFTISKSFWGDTSFFCDVFFGNEMHWFNVFNQQRDAEFCHKTCYYEVRESKVCKYMKRFLDIVEDCYYWKKE